MKNKNVLLFCLLLTIMGGIVMPTFGSEITDVGYFDTDAIQPVLFEDPNGNVYEIKVPAEQAEAWKRQQEEKVNASKGVGSHATTYETQAEQDNISMHERALLVASEKQKELLEEARASCKWGAVGDCTRQIMQKMGQLDTNTPRLTLEQAEELFLDFGLASAKDVPKLLHEYVFYYNHERPAAALGYKSPVQYKTELGF